MSHNAEELGARLDEFARELSQIARRVAHLEASRVAASGDHEEESAPDADDEAGLRFDLSGIAPESLALTGRTLMVIGGAFLLRALTEAGLIPTYLGPFIGVVYAAWWMLRADRIAQADRRRSAVFHGLAAVLIAYPLIFEATSQLKLISPTQGAAELVLFLVFGLGVAARNELRGIASASTIAAVATAIALLVSTHELLIFVTALLLAAVAVEALAFTERWLWLRWVVAIPLDLAVLEMTQTALAPRSLSGGQSPLLPEAVISVALALPLVYLAGIGARTLRSRRQVTSFEVVQAGLALAVGLSSALRLIDSAGAGQAPVAVATLALGAACYAIAFAFIEREAALARSFYTYNTYALALVLVGTWLLLGGSTLTLVWSMLAIIAITIGGRFGRQSLKFHGVVYMVAAAIQSDLLGYAFEGLLLDPSSSIMPLSATLMAVAVATACCYGILLATAVATGFPQRDRWPEGLMATLLIWSAAGIAGAALASWLTGFFGPEASRAIVATARTAVLAALAVGLAWAGRRWSLLELTWLVYPALTIGAGKLLWEDVRYGSPLTIFMSLALYGGALFAAPRLIRTR